VQEALSCECMQDGALEEGQLNTPKQVACDLAPPFASVTGGGAAASSVRRLAVADSGMYVA
jgi:hypothetical protein